MQDFSMDDYGYYNSLQRGWEKPKCLENPLDDNYTVEQVNRLVGLYNKYLEEDSYLNILIKRKILKKTKKERVFFSLYNMKCSLISDSTKKNVWIVKTYDVLEIFKGTFEQCFRYLIKNWYVVPRFDIKEKMMTKI